MSLETHSVPHAEEGDGRITIEPDDLEIARAIADQLNELFGDFPPVELGNSAVYAGQGENYQRWELACIAAGRELDWREFVALPLPGADDPSEHGQLLRRLCELFPHYVYDWHSVARLFCNHLCPDAFDDGLRACVEQGADLSASAFLRAPRPEVIREMEQWETNASQPKGVGSVASVEEVRARIAAAFGGSPDGARVAPKKPS